MNFTQEQISDILVDLEIKAECNLLITNGYVYDTFGISKRFPAKLQVPLIQTESAG